MRSRIALLALLSLTGCSMAPKYQQPQEALPSSLGSDNGPSAADFPWSDWWIAFNDPELNQWIEKALVANTDIRIAAGRLDRARAALGVARADYFPSLSGQGQASRGARTAYEARTADHVTGNNYSLSALLDYEIDLFGRVRSSVSAANQDLLSSEYAFYSMRSMIAAQTATTYFNLIAAREQLRLTEESVRTRTESLRVQEQRFDAGFSSELERQQAIAELADAKVLLPDLRQQVERLETALLLLVGEEPDAIWNGKNLTDSDVALPEPPEVPLDVLPASILERRPDILAADADLRAAYQRIGVAKAQRWPKLSLSGLLGTAAPDVDELFKDPSETWSIAGNVTGPIYDFGRSRNRIRSAEAAREIAEWSYRQVVRQAFQELRDAVSLATNSEDAVDARTDQVAAFSRTYEVAQDRYQSGYSDYLELLDAERGKLSAQLALVEAKLNRLTAAVTLYRALGGGWSDLSDE